MAGERIGLIGLGLLGTALAERFLRAGFVVVGFDVAEERRQALVAHGGESVAAVGTVFASCARVVLSLPTTSVVESVLQAANDQLRPGLLILDTTTGEPEATAALGARLVRDDVHYLDTTVAGSSEQVRNGEALVLVGGEAAACALCRDVLEAFAREWFHLGPWGSGARMKLVVNLVLGLNRAVLAEGLAYARASGLDPGEALRILQLSPAASTVMRTKGPKMLAQDYQPQARLSQHLKDVRLILAAAARVGAHVPLSRLHERLLSQAEAAGCGDLDNAAIFKAYAEGHVES